MLWLSTDRQRYHKVNQAIIVKIRVFCNVTFVSTAATEVTVRISSSGWRRSANW